MRSISVDDTPDFDRSASGSPPNKHGHLLQSRTEPAPNTTPYTPGSQKRFNPFLKDQIPVDATIAATKKPLTPTKEHPLQDLSEDMTELDVQDMKNGEIAPAMMTSTDEDDGYCENNHNIEPKVMTAAPTEDIQNDENKNLIIKDDDLKVLNTALSSNDSLNEGVGVVRTTLPPGKVVRRKKTSGSAKPPASGGSAVSHHRSSFPLAKSVLHKSIEKLEAQMHNLGSETDSSERLEHHDAPVPEWVIDGESVLIRPYNTSGVISFVGPTHFQVCQEKKMRE